MEESAPRAITGSPEHKPSAHNERVAEAIGRFDGIRVRYERQDAAISALDLIRRTGLHNPGQPKRGAYLVAPFGAGKTVMLELLRDFVDESSGPMPGQCPVLLVEIDTAGTTDSVPTAILASLGEPKATAGREGVRWIRATEALRRHGVQLLVFDEFNRAARRHTVAGSFATAIRQHVMDAGVCPVAFVGSEDARTALKMAPGLRQRLGAPIKMDPIDWADEEVDRAIYLEFLDALDAAIVDADILPNISGLARRSTAEKLWLASRGSIRELCSIIREALVEAVGRGSDRIERVDLEYATDGYAIENRFISVNPFAA